MTDKPKLIKVIFEYEDHYDTLEGAETCQKWLDAVNSILGLHQLRTGQKIDGLDEVMDKWKKTEKP